MKAMAESISIAEYKKAVKKPNKFKAIKTVVDGIKFDSKREAKRWGELRLLEMDGQIAKLNRQVRFDLIVNGVKVGRLTVDFTYVENRKLVAEDSKGFRKQTDTNYQLFKLKAALVKAIYGIEVKEV